MKEQTTEVTVTTEPTAELKQESMAEPTAASSEAKQEAKEASKEAKAAAEQATNAAEVANLAAGEAVQQTFSTELKIKDLESLLGLQQTRIEQLFKIMEQTAATVESLSQELTATLTLNQEQIGAVNSAAETVALAAAALVKLHKVQEAKANA